MSPFVERVLNHVGAKVPSNSSQQPQDLAKSLVAGTVNSGIGFDVAQLVSYFGALPAWADFDSEAKRDANRNIAPLIIRSAIKWACSQAHRFSCGKVFMQCQKSSCSARILL